MYHIITIYLCINILLLCSAIYAIGHTEYMFGYKVVQCIMHDIDQCKILVVSHATTLVFLE